MQPGQSLRAGRMKRHRAKKEPAVLVRLFERIALYERVHCQNEVRVKMV